MTIRRSAVLALFTLALAIIACWLAGRTTSAQPSQSSVAPQQQPASSEQKAGTWEYRILTTAVNSVVKYSYTDNKGRTLTNPGPYLEEEINKLAAQGFVVDSFQVASTVSGGGAAPYFSLSGSSQIVVLLKRIKN